MLLRTAISLLPLVALAQIPAARPSPASDEALRARVNEFFQDFVDGKFRAAMELVAEDTKEEYFAAGKAQIKAFKILNIQYAPDLEHATVKLEVRRVWNIQGQPNDVDVPMPTTWKLETGKWVWTHQLAADQWLTPMGPSNIELVKRSAEGTISGVPHGITQQMVDAAGKKIMQQTGLDKSEIKFAAGKSGSDKVVFHNGAPGSIQLELQTPAIPGLTAKLDKTILNLGEDAVLQVAYDPPAIGGGAVPDAAAIRIAVIPFNQSFGVQVSFEAPNK